jgi:predicted MPP superfamily phosphohydrolase
MRTRRSSESAEGEMTSMARWISSLAFLIAGFAVSAAAHYLLWARLIRDVGFSPSLARALTRTLCGVVNALSPDVLVVTGDLVDGSVDDLKYDVAPLADLRSSHGTYFVTGNHEYHVDAPRWCDHLGSLGVRVLRNEYVELKHVLRAT